MAFLKTLMTYINDQLQNPGESSDWHRVFGVYLLRTWHFHCLGIVFLFLQTVNYWFLRILESMNAIALSNFDCQVTGSSSLSLSLTSLLAFKLLDVHVTF